MPRSQEGGWKRASKGNALAAYPTFFGKKLPTGLKYDKQPCCILTKRLPWKVTWVYFAGQLIGSVLGALGILVFIGLPAARSEN